MTEIRHPVDSTFTLDKYSDALSRNAEPRFGKVLFVSEKKS
jgi:hypothetical protein